MGTEKHERIDVFDKTVHKSNDWVRELTQELGWTDPHHALGAFRVVMHTIRDRLPLGEAAALAAEMPTLLRGVYFEGWRPLEKVPTLRHRGELVGKLEEQIGGTYGVFGEENVLHVVRAVLRVLNRHVSPGEVEDARHALPAELRVIWPSEAGASPGT